MTPEFAGNRTRNVIIATGAISIHDAKNGRIHAPPRFGGIVQRRAQDGGH
jgi:hypothetical protein